MNEREIAAEVARLRELAKTLLTAIEALHARIAHAESDPRAGATLPPPQRPTTRIRKPTAGKLPSLRPGRPEEPVNPSSARGAYRIVPPKR